MSTQVFFIFNLIIIIIAITSCTCTAQTCQPFQVFDKAQAAPSDTSLRCSVYSQSTCCDPGTAKRAYNWALEDDGCGVVTGDCLQYAVDVACWMNCSPNLNMTTRHTSTGLALRPVVTLEWANKVWDACARFAWCGTSQKSASTCTFLKTETVRTGKSSTGTKVTVSGLWDTCTFVSDLTSVEFAQNILGVAVVDGASPAMDPTRQIFIKNHAQRQPMIWMMIITAVVTYMSL